MYRNFDLSNILVNWKEDDKGDEGVLDFKLSYSYFIED